MKKYNKLTQSDDDDPGNTNLLNEQQIWDGTESEIIADDEVEEFEEQFTGTGIKLDYTLTLKEVLDCLKEFSDIKIRTGKLIAETVILAVLATLCMGAFFTHHGYINVVVAMMAIFLIGLIWIVPIFIVEDQAKDVIKRGSMYAEIYPDNIVVGMNGMELEIPLDGTCEFVEFKNMFVIFPPSSEMILIPMRVIEPELLADVHAMLIAGTSPREKED